MIKLTRFQSNTSHPTLAELHGRTVYINEKLILSVETVFPYTVRSAADLNLPLKEKPREKATQITYAFGVGEEPFSEMVQESVEEVLRMAGLDAGGQAADDAGAKLAKAMWDVDLVPFTLSQPHTADERVVEALQAARAHFLKWMELSSDADHRTSGAVIAKIDAALSAKEGR